MIKQVTAIVSAHETLNKSDESDSSWGSSELVEKNVWSVVRKIDEKLDLYEWMVELEITVEWETKKNMCWYNNFMSRF